ncbi:MAG: cytochrome b [Rhodospirillaceae bacterium]|nr:cytochrome b [Rhodospirillaceae bacterium]
MTQHATGYSLPARVLHWVTALAIVCVVPLGIAMVNAGPGPGQNRLYDLHRSFGALVLALTGARLVWRLLAPPPPLVPDLPPWQVIAARIAHAALYVLLFAVPLMGWAGTSAFGAPIWVFGLFELPPLLDRNRDLATILLTVHAYLAFTLTGVVALHIAAALHHHLVRKDDTLRRMTVMRPRD